MTLSIVTVTHNSVEDIARYAASFLASGSGESEAIEFVVVENSGQPETETALLPLRAAGFPVTFIETKNRGFGSACNAGAALASGDLLIFANPDIEFLDPVDPVARLAGSWGTVSQINATGDIQSFDVLPEAKTVIGEMRGRYRRMTPPPAAFSRSLVPLGAFFCIDRSLFRRVGGFDESFFLYHEEAELARRLHRLAAAPGFVPEVRIAHRHFGSQASRRSTFRHEMDGFFNYVAVTGEKGILSTRAIVLAMQSVFSSIGRYRLRIFLKGMAKRLFDDRKR